MLKKKFIENSRLTKKQLDTSIDSECDNSFLVEVSHNLDVAENFRSRIEEKYQQSITNSNYKFPRGSLSKTKLLGHKKTLRTLKPSAKATPQRKPMVKVPSLSLKKNASSLTKLTKSKTPAHQRFKSLARDSSCKHSNLDLNSTVSRSTASSQNPLISSHKISKNICLKKIKKR